MIINFIFLIFVLISSLLAVAFFSLFERKVLAFIQIRKGPNKVGPIGLLQPISDAMKLVSKVELSSHSSVSFIFFFSPLLLFILSCALWVFYPYIFSEVNKGLSCYMIMVILSVKVYGLVLSGWFSNSKYATLGSSRAFVMSISYEIGLTMLFVSTCIIYSSSSLEEFVLIQMGCDFISFYWVPAIIMGVIMVIAELNRSPFDLSEGESELVGGYSVEYGGLSYTLIFLGENLSLLFSAILLGSIYSVYSFWFLVFLLVWVRSAYPRVRFDQMVSLFWISVLPISMIYLIESILLIL